jgi:hypothetical protein
VIVEARHLVFKHNHPVASGQTMDAVMTAHNSEDNYKRGLEIFTRRNPIAGFGNIGYGIRVQQIDNSFFWCWSRQLLWNADHRKLDTVLRPATEWPHAPAMNILLHWFLNSPADSLLSIDDDMEWEPPVIEILRATPGADVVMPLTCCRRAPHNPLVLGEWDLNAGHPTMIDAAVIAKGGIIPVRYVGLGFTLIKRWVLEKLVEKNHGEPPFIFDAFRAEDGKFSEDARAVGAKLAVNTDVRVGHRYTAAAYWNKEEGCVDHSENDYGRSLIIKQRKE